MVAFGKRVGGGRRLDQRVSTPIIAQLSTLAETFQAVLVDLSATGARLEGSNLPAKDKELSFRAGALHTVATVKWRGQMECGIQFYEPLQQAEVVSLRKEVANAAGLPPEMRAALDDWVAGFAR